MARTYIRFFGVILAVIACFVATAAWSGQEFQEFANAPADWVGRAASDGVYAEAMEWSNTNLAGVAAGEGQAKFHRIKTDTDGYNEATSYFADTDLGGTLDVSQQVLHATGRVYIDDFTAYPDFGGGVWLGWFRPGGQCRVGIMFNDNGGAGAGWYAGIWNNSEFVGQAFVGSVAKGVGYSFEIEFDNNEGTYGNGRLVARLTPDGGATEQAVVHLASKLSNYELGAFGLARPNPYSVYSPQTMMDIRIDDTTYTSNTIPYPRTAFKEYQFFNSNPADWASRTTTGGEYTEIADFSSTNFAGSASGEARAKFHRINSTGDQINDSVASYADTDLGGPLNVQNQILEANGKFIIKDFTAYPDLGNGFYLGWFRPGGACHLGIMINNNEPYGGAGLGWYARIVNNYGQIVADRWVGSVSPNVRYSFEIEFNNRDGEYGKGRLVCKMTPEGSPTETAVLHLADYLSNYELTAFGLSRPNPSAYAPWNYKNIDIYADDLTYTSNIQGTLPSVTISGAKLGVDGSSVTCGGIVSAANWDYYYIESADRTSGIRVEEMNTGRSVGDRVTIAGPITTLDSGERCITSPQLLNSEGGYDVNPVAMTQKNLGGGTLAGQQGVAGGIGLNNIGLLVVVTGLATYVDDSTFTIEDGSGRNVKVVCPYGSAPYTGTFVTVTGISSCEKISGSIGSVVLVPTFGGDIATVSQ